MNYKKIIFIVIVLLLDQISKYFIAVNNVFVTIINDFFYIEYATNKGAAFSILSGQNILLIIITLVLIYVIYRIMKSYKEGIINDISFGLLYGGILGNLFDRLFLGYVRDFISFKFGNYYFPTFNTADTGIVIGAAILIVATIVEEVKNRGNKSRKRRKN